jgi:MFS family permease
MGAQESLGAFARILGPLSGGFVWELTASGSYPWDHHTAFHLCGVLMLLSALLTLRLPPLSDLEVEQPAGQQMEKS